MRLAKACSQSNRAQFREIEQRNRAQFREIEHSTGGGERGKKADKNTCC